jgi:hypothetical protein
MVADLFTLTGVVPLDRRNQKSQAENSAPFRKPTMGMYYGSELNATVGS